MKIILNNYKGAASFKDALRELAQGAEALSLAVSYLQVGGWELFRRYTSGIVFAKMRIVCTDQMGITQPVAVMSAIKSGVQIRKYTGNMTYHPKIYLAHGRGGRPTRFLVSSANMSYSAFTDSVEAGLLGREPSGLFTLSKWFDDLFHNRSADFTAERLLMMQKNWRAFATRRAHARLRLRRELFIPQAEKEILLDAEDIDTLEDVFATVQLPIGCLNMDYAGNNIRNIDRVRTVLANWNTISTSLIGIAGKQRSELKLLGFADGRALTALGQAAAITNSRDEVARLWCAWLQRIGDAELFTFNERLLVAKRVFTQFWRLDKEVREYFLKNVEKPNANDRPVLQIIELLCNANDIVQDLSLDDMKTLSSLLKQPQRLPGFVRKAVFDYQDNKGMRGWDYPDRRILPMAWKRALMSS